jgi:hypothetical protein
LKVENIRLASIAEALDDNGDMTSWWFDPATGEVETYLSEYYRTEDDEEDDPRDLGYVHIDAEGSRTAYLEMVEFAEAVADVHARDLLLRALEGRGAFRRFRETVYEISELREQWFGFSAARGERRALRWLLSSGFVEVEDASQAIEVRRRVADTVLDAVGTRSGVDVAAGEVPARWAEIEASVGAGTTVTITRDGAPWALIEPCADRRGQVAR